MILLGIVGLALILGCFLPTRWGLWGFLAAAAGLFVVYAGVNTARGYEGLTFEETMLLFNDSWAAYIGFNLQITYRAFALPLLGLAGMLVFRLRRR